MWENDAENTPILAIFHLEPSTFSLTEITQEPRWVRETGPGLGVRRPEI